MTYKDPEKGKQYILEYKKRKRRERGLMKTGRKPQTEEERQQSKINRSSWEKEWRKQYLEYSPQKRLLWAARKRAKSKGLEFNISAEDIIIPEICPVLGIELLSHVARGNSRTNIMSLDRIGNTKGYIQGNIWVISHLANTMKSNASVDQLLKFATAIIKLYG